MRGWKLRVAASPSEMIQSIQDHCDILLLDGGRLHRPLQTLRSVRHSAPHLPILYFDGEESDELDILADRRLPCDADDDVTFTAIKALVRDLPRRRREFLEWTVNRAAGALTKLRSPRELSRTVAEDAQRLFGDWVAVHLLDGQGDVYSTESAVASAPAAAGSTKYVLERLCGHEVACG